MRQEGRVLEQRCCLGNGQLSSMVGGRAARQQTTAPHDQKQQAAASTGGAVHLPPRSPPPPIRHLKIEMAANRLSHSSKPASDSAALTTSGPFGTDHFIQKQQLPVVAATTTTGISSTVLRGANSRFTPTPSWPAEMMMMI